MSVLHGLSDLTWAWPNNAASWFLVDWWYNLWASLFGGHEGFLRFTPVSAKLDGPWGILRGGAMVDSAPHSARTVGHLTYLARNSPSDWRWARTFVPAEPDPAKVIELALYGSTLRLDPAGTVDGQAMPYDRDKPNRPVLLAGSTAAPSAVSWTRLGGRAAPVFPGSRMPCFPAGGVHLKSFDTYQLPAPQDCVLTELHLDDKLAVGSFERQVRFTASPSDVDLTAGDALVLIDATTAYLGEVARVSPGTGATQIRVRFGAGAPPSPGAVELHRVAAPDPAPANLGDGTVADQLAAPASSPWRAGDAVELAWAGKTAVALVRRLEAKLMLDAAVPAPRAHGSVSLLEAVGDPRKAKRGTDPDLLELDPGDAAPGEGSALTVQRGGDEIPVIVRAGGDARHVRCDRPLGGAAGGALTYRTLGHAAALGGEASVPAGESTVIYQPTAAGAAPSTGYALVESSGGKQVRRIAGLAYDALVLDRARPGPPGTSYTATRRPARASKLDGKRRVEAVSLVRVTSSDKVSPDAKGVVVHGLSQPPPLSPGTLGGTLTAKKLQLTPSGRFAFPLTPSVGNLLWLTSGTASDLALVLRQQLDLTLDRPLPADVKEPLEMVRLVELDPTYAAEVTDAMRLVVRPEVGGKPTEMPRFHAGELVRVFWTATTDLETYRIASVDGTTLTLEAGLHPLPPPGTTPVTIQRLDAGDQSTGTYRCARNVHFTSIDRTKLACDVWAGSHLAVGDHVAVITGGRSFPAVVKTQDQLACDLARAGSATVADGVITFQAVDLSRASFTDYIAELGRDGDDLVVPEITTQHLATAGAPQAVLLAYLAGPRSVAGRLFSATVKPPAHLDDDKDLTLYEATIEHEMHHTRQSQSYGPLWLAWFPLWAIDFIREADPDIDLINAVKAIKVIHDIVRTVTTVGGVTELVAGSTFASLLWLLGLAYHYINLLIKWAAGSDSLFTDAIDPFAIDWFDADTPDPARPTAIRIQPHDGKSLTPKTGDRLQFKPAIPGLFAKRLTVVTVAGDGTVELDDTPPGDRPLQVAPSSAAADDPSDEIIDNYLLKQLGLGWMAVMFDPWGQLDARSHPSSKLGRFLLHVGRYAFGTKAWSVMIPGTVVRQHELSGTGNPRSFIEVDPSFLSGDSYFPWGMLRGTGATEADLKAGKILVGDVAEYWYVSTGSVRDRSDYVIAARMDRPGIHWEPLPAFMPYVEAPPAPGTDEPNLGSQAPAAAAAPGRALSAVFVDKAHADPEAPDTSGIDSLRHFSPSQQGWIPNQGPLEQSMGAYVAFTSPTPQSKKHRVTVVASILGIQDCADARANHALVRDLEVTDVEVRIGGRLVKEGDDVPLLPLQRARLEVTPAGSRRYDLTVTRPTDGKLRRQAGAGGVVTLIAGGAAALAEPVEVSRFYEYRARPSTDHRNPGYSGSVLADRGIHVPGDLHIAVRRFKVHIDPVVPVRDKPDPDALRDTTTKPFAPGERAELLVPVRVRPSTVAKHNPRITVAYAGTPPPESPLPRLAPELGTADADSTPALRTMLADGGSVISVPFPADAPPEEEATIGLEIDVGPDPGVTLTASLRLSPHFRLTRSDGGGFTVAPGATLILTTGGATLSRVEVSGAGVTAGEPSGSTVTLTVAAGAATGDRRVLATDDKQRQAARTIRVT
jgi:hypothetical protein